MLPPGPNRGKIRKLSLGSSLFPKSALDAKNQPSNSIYSHSNGIRNILPLKYVLFLQKEVLRLTYT